MVKLFRKNSNPCDHNPPTSQTDRRTDRHATTRHRAVKTQCQKLDEKIGFGQFFESLCLVCRPTVDVGRKRVPPSRVGLQLKASSLNFVRSRAVTNFGTRHGKTPKSERALGVMKFHEATRRTTVRWYWGYQPVMILRSCIQILRSGRFACGQGSLDDSKISARQQCVYEARSEEIFGKSLQGA